MEHPVTTQPNARADSVRMVRVVTPRAMASARHARQTVCEPDAAGTDPASECEPGSCDGLGACSRLDHIWDESLPTYGQEITSGNGRVAALFYVIATTNFGDGLVTGSNVRPTLVVSTYTDAGAFAWKRTFTASQNGNLDARRVVIDDGGNVIVLGWVEGSNRQLTVESGQTYTTTSSWTVFVTKFTPEGAESWTRRFASSDGFPDGLAVDSLGRVYLGVNAYDIDFGTGPLGQGMALARLSPTGVVEQSRGFAQGRIHDMVATDDGPIVMGSATQGINFGGAFLPVDDPGSMVLFQLAGDNLSHRWSRAFGAADFTLNPLALSATPSGDLCMTGTYMDTIDFGGGSWNAVDFETFVARFGGDGTHRWSRRLPGEVDFYPDGPVGVSADAASNCVFSGNFTGTMDFGQGGVSAMGEHDAYVAKYAADGTLLVARTFGNGDNLESPRISSMGDATYMLGRTSSLLDFGGGPRSGEYLLRRGP